MTKLAVHAGANKVTLVSQGYCQAFMPSSGAGWGCLKKAPTRPQNVWARVPQISREGKQRPSEISEVVSARR